MSTFVEFDRDQMEIINENLSRILVPLQDSIDNIKDQLAESNLYFKSIAISLDKIYNIQKDEYKTKNKNIYTGGINKS
jgi:hypothetical protein